MRYVEATGSHPSVLLDGRLNPGQKVRDAGECCKLLPGARPPRPRADDPDKHVSAILVHNCKRAATVTLGKEEDTCKVMS